MPRVCVICINVTDMDRALGFYRDVLGFRVEDRAHYPDIVQLAHDGVPLILQRVPKRADVDYPRQAGTLLDFETDDLASEMARFRKAGVKLLHEAAQPCPVGVFFAFRDPDGNVHEMLEFRAPASRNA